MALMKCKECGQEVSSTAKTCPSCGVSGPARYGWNGVAYYTVAVSVTLLRMAIIFVFIGLLWLLLRNGYL